VNLEYLQLDSRSFVTGEDRALSLLFGASSDESVEARVTVKRIAQRLATLFATLKVTGRTQPPTNLWLDGCLLHTYCLATRRAGLLWTNCVKLCRAPLL